MKVYLVWDGYEDVTAVFLSEKNAQAFVAKEIAERSAHKWFSPDMLAINEMDVADAP